MPRGVARQVVRPHAHPATQVPQRAVAVASGVGPGLVMKILSHYLMHRIEHVLWVTVVATQPVPRLGGGQIGLVHLYAGLGHTVQP